MDGGGDILLGDHPPSQDVAGGGLTPHSGADTVRLSE